MGADEDRQGDPQRYRPHCEGHAAHHPGAVRLADPFPEWSPCMRQCTSWLERYIGSRNH